MAKKKLMLLESPHKAKAIQQFLSSDYKTIATVGSMFNIENASTEPQKKKFDRYGVSTTTWERNLKCTNTKQFALIKAEVKSGKYDEIIVSTDPDRAGALIGQEVIDALATDIKKNNISITRATWTEITKKAVTAGLQNKTVINKLEVDAAATRSVYDRLFGFAISGNVQRTLREKSAGRVQSPALRFIVEREKERLAFTAAEYLSLTGTFTVGSKKLLLDAKLLSLGEEKIAIGSSFDSKGQANDKVFILTPGNLEKTQEFLNKCSYDVSDVSVKPYSRKPPAPYVTSTFQQDVGTRLRLSSKQLMSIAQRLFDASWISYSRTDSPHLGDEALNAAHKEALSLFGPSKSPSKPTPYKAKGQGGHEALRPVCDEKTGEFRAPAKVKAQLDAIDKNAFKVYEAIYNRTVASQMNPAVGFTTTVKISSMNTPKDKVAVFATAATTYTDLGWMALTKPIEEEGESNNVISDKIEKDEAALLKKLTVKEHKTTPPARFSEPSLVQKLSDTDIGRPSTFASIVTVNQDRGYVKKKGGQLYPTWAGMKVAQYLEGKIPNFVAYEASALMEQELDKIEQGLLNMDPFLKKAWKEIEKDVLSLNDNINWEEVNELSTIELNNDYNIRVNAFGSFLTDLTTPIDTKGNRPGVKLSDDENVAEYDFSDPEVCKALFEASQNRVEAENLGTLTDGNYKGWVVTARDGKYGAYVQAVSPEVAAAYAAGDKPPKSASKAVNQPLPEGVTLETVTMEAIAPLFAEVKLPRWSPDGKWLVGIGKKGAYLGFRATVKGRPAFKSLDEKYDPRTIDFAEVQKLWEEAVAAAPAKKEPVKKPAAKKKAPAKKPVKPKGKK